MGDLPVSAARPRQAFALLSAIAGVAGIVLAAQRHAAVGIPARPAGIPLIAVAATSLVLVAVGSGVWLRRRHIDRLLASRVTWALVPADTHDPSLEEVARFAAQLGRVRRRGRRRLERPAAAVRVRIHSRRGGRLGYQLQAAASARGVLGAALGSYPDVELRDCSETVDLDPPGQP